MTLLEDAADHLISCPVKDWLATYAKSNGIEQWSAVEWEAFLDSVVKALKKKKVLNSSGWRPIRVMSFNGVDEETTYQAIENIAEAVYQVAISIRPTLQRTTVIKCYSDLPEEPETNILGGRAILMHPEQSAPDTVDTVMAAEFKLDDTPRTCQQNETRVLDDARHIMHKDPRRRFTFGLTIEGDFMRLWNFSRSHTGVTDGFDYHKHPRHFIHFLLFILFAPISTLGFDPTVKRVLDEEGKVAYLYKVGGSWYQTIGNLLADQSSPIVGSATRVWEVRKVLAFEPDGSRRLDDNIVVLKDLWSPEKARGEKSIQDAIFANLRELDEGTPNAGTPLSHVEMAKKHFMTILEDELVQLREQNDITPKPREFAQSTEFTQGWDDEDAARKIEHRMHRRIVFKERCHTVCDLHDFPDMLECLRHNIEGLWYMRLAGYVHRDISYTNCMWYKSEGQGKISDLEFAKPYNQLTADEHRTGTSPFMAVEAQSQAYFSLKNRESESFKDFHRRAQSFTVNFLHDLESVLWMYVWFLFHRTPELSIEDGERNDDHLDLKRATPEQLESYKRMREELFRCGIDGSALRFQVVARRNYGDLLTVLEPFYANSWHMVKGLFFFDDLYHAYKTLEASKPVMDWQHGMRRWDVDQFTYAPYDRLRAILQEISNVLQPSKTAPKSSLKRALTTDQTTEEDEVAQESEERPMKKIRLVKAQVAHSEGKV